MQSPFLDTDTNTISRPLTLEGATGQAGYAPLVVSIVRVGLEVVVAGGEVPLLIGSLAVLRPQKLGTTRGRRLVELVLS